MSGWQESQQAFAEATDWFVRTTTQVDSRWNAPGLGEWDLRALVGHTSRALLTLEAYLRQPADTVDVGSPAEYFRTAREVAPAEAVAARGRESGEALGADPAGAVAEMAARVVPLVAEQTGDEVVTTVVGGMRLADYLPTRTFELVVHTTDLATARGLETRPPAAAAAQALTVVTDLAVKGGQAGRLLLAATGRSQGPFTVL